MFTEKKRCARLSVIAVLMNLLCFLTAYYLRLPMWLDMTGTIYISIILDFHYGFVAGLLNSAISSIFFYGTNSLGYYVVSLLVALTVGVITQRLKDCGAGKWLILFWVVFLVGSFANVILTFLLSAGTPSEYWTNNLYRSGMEHGLPAALSTAISVTLVKLIDSFVSMLIVATVYYLTPVKYRTDAYVVRNRIERFSQR